MYKAGNRSFSAGFPRQFESTYKAKQLSPLPSFIMSKHISNTSYLTLSNNQSPSPSDTMKMKAHKQKAEMLTFLTHTNLSPQDVLIRLSTYATPYADLIQIAAEELGYAVQNIRSQGIDDITRKSVVESAKKEVELQNLTEKMVRMKSEMEDLKQNIQKRQLFLDKLNSDIARMQLLLQSHNIDANAVVQEENKKRKKMMEENELLAEKLVESKPLPFNEKVYQELWSEHNDLEESLGELNTKFKEIQERQRGAIRERAKNIISIK